MQDACHVRSSILSIIGLGLSLVCGNTFALPPDVTLLLEQAPDKGCDSNHDSPFSSAALDLAPSHCVIYRLTATNTGQTTAHDVTITDQLPAFTLYQVSATCSAPSCTIVEPLTGEHGSVTGSVEQLLAGETVSLEYTVLLE